MHPNKLNLLSADGKFESPSSFAICEHGDVCDSCKFENSDNSIKVQESSNYHNPSIHYECRSKRIHESEFHNYSWHIPREFSNTIISASTTNSNPSIIYHKDVMNFARILSNSNGNAASSSVSAVSTPRSPKFPITHCVMCGRQDVTIPSQNKHICKICDSSYWLYIKFSFVFKFCKGCKNFFPLSEFADKPEGTKCYKCRQRGRDNYMQKKNQLDLNVLIKMNSTSEKDGEELSLANSPHIISSNQVINRNQEAAEKVRGCDYVHNTDENDTRSNGIRSYSDLNSNICNIDGPSVLGLLSSPYDRIIVDASSKKKTEPKSSSYKSAFLARIITPAAIKNGAGGLPRATVFDSPPNVVLHTPSNILSGSTTIRSGLTSVETNESSYLNSSDLHEIRPIDDTCHESEESHSRNLTDSHQLHINKKRNRSFSIADVPFESCTTDAKGDSTSGEKAFRVESPVSFTEGNPLMTLAMLTSSEKLTSP